MYIAAKDLHHLIGERTLIELTNDTTQAKVVNEEIVNMAIESATETIDGYLRSRYILPLQEAPTLIRNICLQIARYWLYTRRAEGRGFPENVKDTYKQALKDLEQIAKGQLHLGLLEKNQENDILPDVSKFRVKAPLKTDLNGY